MRRSHAVEDVIVIVGLGIDLIEHFRVQQELARGDWRQENGIFTSEEIRRCKAGKNPALHYAACFAAKEAVLKALGAEVGNLAIFSEVEVKLGTGNEYGIVLHGRLRSEASWLGVRHINLSIAATKRETGAMVILES
jgi:holo-[acyl-carrier protein] synthase